MSMELVARYMAGEIRVVARASNGHAAEQLVDRVVAAEPTGVVQWVAVPQEPEAMGQPAGSMWLTIEADDGGGSLRYIDPQQPQIAWHTGSSSDTRVSEKEWRAAVQSFAQSGQRPAEVGWQPALPEDAPQAPLDSDDVGDADEQLRDASASNAAHGACAELDESAASGHLRAAKHGLRHAQAIFEMLVGSTDSLLWGDMRARLRYAVQQLTVLVPAMPDPPGEPPIPEVEGDTMLSALLGGSSTETARQNLTAGAALVDESVTRLRVAVTFADVVGRRVVESVVDVVHPVARTLERQAGKL